MEDGMSETPLVKATSWPPAVGSALRFSLDGNALFRHGIDSRYAGREGVVHEIETRADGTFRALVVPYPEGFTFIVNQQHVILYEEQ
jgi:hypothetical protein